MKMSSEAYDPGGGGGGIFTNEAKWLAICNFLLPAICAPKSQPSTYLTSNVLMSTQIYIGGVGKETPWSKCLQSVTCSR